jgi:hypothetical protein
MTLKRLLPVLCVFSIAISTQATELPEKVEFNKHIRALLSDRCFLCHGPGAGTREADLRLDLREEAVKERDGVRALVPGDPEASEAILRILSDDPDEQMPPKKSKLPPLTRMSRRSSASGWSKVPSISSIGLSSRSRGGRGAGAFG